MPSWEVHPFHPISDRVAAQLTCDVQTHCSRLRAENGKIHFPGELINGAVPVSPGSDEKVPEGFIRPRWGIICLAPRAAEDHLLPASLGQGRSGLLGLSRKKEAQPPDARVVVGKHGPQTSDSNSAYIKESDSCWRQRKWCWR